MLRQFALAIGESTRAHLDTGFRLGGDEFALLLASSSASQAAEVVERIRSFCARHDPLWAVGAFDFSAGIVQFEPEETAQDLLRRSDAAMYRQKETHGSPGHKRPTPLSAVPGRDAKDNALET